MDDDWELKFEHIDWVDISDAELSGDQVALEHLMNKSLEIKRQASNNIPSTPASNTPLTHSTPNDSFPPQSTPKDEIHCQSLDLQQQEDMSISHNRAISLSMLSTPNIYRTSLGGVFRKPFSYAQATRGSGKAGKRKIGERIGVSPIEVPTKRHAFRDLRALSDAGLMKTPTDIQSNVEMETENTTPEGDRPLRCTVQRRLFGGQILTSEKTNNPPWYSKEDEERITDSHKLSQRQKQIEYGKNTVGYEMFTQSIPKWKRKPTDPWTPDKYKSCSTRSWQGQIKHWRRNLHKWDPQSDLNQQFTTEDAALCDVSLDYDECPLDA